LKAHFITVLACANQPLWNFLGFVWRNRFDSTQAFERKTNMTGWLVACLGLS